MCTAVFYRSPKGGSFLGRTMDFSWPLSPSVFYCPPGLSLEFALAKEPGQALRASYGFLGIGQRLSCLSLADGVNEAGLAVAALYFPGCARYDNPNAPETGASSGDCSASDRSPRSASGNASWVSSVGLTAFLLGICPDVRQAARLLPSLHIAGVPDEITGQVSPLHWLIADRTGACMAVEKTDRGLQLIENPIGVLSNSPSLPWHLTNLRNYLSLSSAQTEEADWSGASLTAFGQGGGSFGLPGGYTPPSRFVRTAWVKSQTKIPDDETQAINAGFHILAGVSIPKGCVRTLRGTWDYTQYTSFFSLNAPSCFFSTYEDRQVRRISFPAPSQCPQGRIMEVTPLNLRL